MHSIRAVLVLTASQEEDLHQHVDELNSQIELAESTIAEYEGINTEVSAQISSTKQQIEALETELQVSSQEIKYNFILFISALNKKDRSTNSSRCKSPTGSTKPLP